MAAGQVNLVNVLSRRSVCRQRDRREMCICKFSVAAVVLALLRGSRGRFHLRDTPTEKEEMEKRQADRYFVTTPL